MTGYGAFRHGAVILAAIAISGCVGRPGFIPTTKHLYARFEPLAEPRPEVPVGALWIRGYGPTGDGAGADNLVTKRSLSGFTFDADFQASLTLGLLKFLDVDPSFRKKVVARFSDLSIVRVKDWSKLPGPAGEPRIYEALKAGTISITTAGTAGLDIESRAFSQNMPAVGRGTTGLSRTLVIDGKDLIFAVHVASHRPAETKAVKISVSTKRPAEVSLGRYRLMLTRATGDEAAGASGCARPLLYRLISRAEQETVAKGTMELNQRTPSQIFDMPVPEEGLGGALLTKIRVTLLDTPKSNCVKSLEIGKVGHATTSFAHSGARDW